MATKTRLRVVNVQLELETDVPLARLASKANWNEMLGNSPTDVMIRLEETCVVRQKPGVTVAQPVAKGKGGK